MTTKEKIKKLETTILRNKLSLDFGKDLPIKTKIAEEINTLLNSILVDYINTKEQYILTGILECFVKDHSGGFPVFMFNDNFLLSLTSFEFEYAQALKDINYPQEVKTEFLIIIKSFDDVNKNGNG